MSSGIETLKYHLVFCTKYRYRLLTSEIAGFLKELIAKMQDWYKFQIISLAVETEHVHILFSIEDSAQDIKKLIQAIKGYSSRALRKKFSQLMVYPNLWSPSHFLSSAGDVSAKTIESYISSQGLSEDEIVQRTFVYKVLNPTNKKLTQLNNWLEDPTSRPKALQQSFKRNGKPEEQLYQIALRNDVIKVVPSTVDSTKYWLSVGGGNGWERVRLGLLGRDLPQDCRVKDSKLVLHKDGWYAHLVVEEARVLENSGAKKILAIDLGISHPITAVLLNNTSVDKEVFLGSEIKKINYCKQQRIAKLQSAGKTAITKRVAKSQRSKDNYVHCYTKYLVGLAKKEGATIIVGNLHGITKTWDKETKKRNKTFRRKAKPTPYGKIMSQLLYKGSLNGVQVAFQNEAYTSKTCSKCGSLGTRKGDRFSCACGYQNQADLNGAINVAKAYRLSCYDTTRVLERVSEGLPKPEPLVFLGDPPL